MNEYKNRWPEFKGITILILYTWSIMPLSAQFRLPDPLLFPTDQFDRVDHLEQDNRGLLWLATNRGLFCFDGAVFRRINHSPNNISAIDNGMINDLLLDRKGGKLWIATTVGATVLDLNTETFTDYSFARLDAFPLSTGECSSLFRDARGAIWFGLFHFGLIRLDSTLHYFPFKEHATEPNSITIYQVAQDVAADSILWLATSPYGLVRFNTETGRYEVPDQSGLKGVSSGILFFTTLFPRGEKIFLGNRWDRRGYIYNLSSGHFKQIDNDPPQGQSLPCKFSYMQNRSPNSLWVFNYEQLLILDTRGDTLTGWFSRPEEIESFADGCLATADKLWVFSSKGLLLYDLSSYQVENHVFPQDEIGNPYYLASALENEGNAKLWLGFLKGNAVYGYNRETRQIQKIPAPEGDANRASRLIRLSDGRILAVVGDAFYELREDRLLPIPLGEDLATSKVELTVPVEDKKGFLWQGSRWGGLYRLDLKTGDYRQITNVSGISEIRHLFKDRDDNIWLPYSSGFVVYHAQKDTVYYFPYQTGEELTVDYPRGFAQDREGQVWISDIKVGGLMRVDPARLEEGIQERVIADNGPFSNQMRALETDRQGRIWAVTKAGLQVFDPREKTFRLFGASAGFRLRSKDPLWSNFVPSYLKRLSNGELLVGYHDGFAIFHPDSLQGNQELPNPYLLFLETGDQLRISSATFTAPDKMRMPYDQNAIELGFSVLAWREAEKIRFIYRLKGLETDWVETKQRSVRYPDLSPGVYTFQLYALNSDGLRGEKPLEIHFEILPPWWRTGWAYAAYVFLVVGLGRLFYNYKKNRWQLQAQLSMEHREAERLKELNDFKTRFYTNITHEFRTPLTIILGMVDQLKYKSGESYNQGVEMIRRNGRNLLRLVNQMLDLSKLESGNLPLRWVQGDVVAFIKYLAESFQSYASSRNIDLTFTAEVEMLNMDYDPEKLQQVISNLISNAIKFTPEGGAVKVTVSTEGRPEEQVAGQLLVTVEDTGVGMDEATLAFIFDRFYQAPPKRQASPGSDGDVSGSSIAGNGGSDPLINPVPSGYGLGTGIGLALVKELVHLMGGRVEVRSIPGSGSMFSVLLPIRRTASISEKGPETPSPAELFPEDSAASVKTVSFTEEPLPRGMDKPLLLLVEDNRDVVRYLSGLLEASYRLEIAYDGHSGIEKALARVPDIIISDVMMPEADGYELCQTLKTNLITSHIPIILLTAKADAASRLEGLQCGADAYLAKPFNKEELFVRLRKTVELRAHLQEKYRGGLISSKGDSEGFPREDAFIQRIQEQLEEHYSDENFGLSQLVRELGMSRTQFYRKFKALTGRQPGQYLRSFRMHKARNLLLHSDLNVTEVAYRVGFSDPSYFSRAFKKEFGVAPSELSSD